MIHPGNRARRRNPGFTLVEMMIVLVIVSIMTMLILPEMRGTYEEAMLRSNARKISNAFRTAYSSAVMSHQQHRVRIDPTDAQLTVETRTNDPENPYTPLKKFEREISQLHKTIAIRYHEPRPQLGDLPPEAEENNRSPVSQQRPPGVFLFNPDGTCEGQDIELRDRDGVGLLIRLNGVTSRVRFEPLERQER